MELDDIIIAEKERILFKTKKALIETGFRNMEFVERTAQRYLTSYIPELQTYINAFIPPKQDGKPILYHHCCGCDVVWPDKQRKEPPLFHFKPIQRYLMQHQVTSGFCNPCFEKYKAEHPRKRK